MNDLEKTGLLLTWLSILNDGYVKPDVNAVKGMPTSNNTGVVRDTKDYMPYISKINDELADLFQLEGIEKRDGLSNFKTK